MKDRKEGRERKTENKVVGTKAEKEEEERREERMKERKMLVLF